MAQAALSGFRARVLERYAFPSLKCRQRGLEFRDNGVGFLIIFFACIPTMVRLIPLFYHLLLTYWDAVGFPSLECWCSRTQAWEIVSSESERQRLSGGGVVFSWGLDKDDTVFTTALQRF